MSTGSALLDMYLQQKGAVKTAAAEKTAEEIHQEKIAAAAHSVFERELDQYLFDFAANDLSR